MAASTSSSASASHLNNNILASPMKKVNPQIQRIQPQKMHLQIPHHHQQKQPQLHQQQMDRLNLNSTMTAADDDEEEIMAGKIDTHNPLISTEKPPQ